MLTYHDDESNAFDIINSFLRFAELEVEKRRAKWKTNDLWEYIYTVMIVGVL